MKKTKAPLFIKLMILFLCISLIPMYGLFYITLNNVSTSLTDSAYQQLIIARDGRQETIENYFDERKTDISVLSYSPAVLESLALFEEVYNPNNLYNDGFNEVSDKFHTYFTEFIDQYGYYDLFLMDLQGNLVYTVIKEDDFGTNLMNGPYKDSGLGDVFRAGKNGYSVGDYEPYEPSAGIPAAFISHPVKNPRGQVVGVVALQLSDDDINSVMTNATGLGETGETYLVGADYLMRSDSRFSEEKAIGVKEVRSEAIDDVLQGNSNVIDTLDYRGEEVFSAYSPLNIEGLNWGIIAEIDKTEAMSMEVVLKRNAYQISLIILVIVIVISLLFALSIVRPVKVLLTSAKEIATGDFRNSIKVKSKDEIGELGYYFEQMRINLNNMMKHIKEEAGSMSGRILESTNTLAAATEQNTQSAEQVTLSIGEISNGIEKQKVFIEEISEAMNEVARGTQHFAETAYNVSEATAKMNKETKIGNEAVEKAESQMNSINDAVNYLERVNNTLNTSSNQIGQIIEVIGNISSQTNLLALNAAIEAARAGEYGKGFAVVADEIRVLADQSKKSTDEIGQIIKEILKETKESVEAVQGVIVSVEEGKIVVNQAGDSFRTILKESEGINNQIQEVSALAEEISASAQEVTASTTNLTEIAATSSESVHTVNGLSEEQLQSMEEVIASSRELESMVEALNGLMMDFKL
ncbi:methyl-accepting chemotaxis protein [Natranaerovirga pectinivora]|uniref:Methyl-accepting chemotaxis protein n=1 Tax=Natranaerovirga pectinivora TaxID=682400 RepID=A0A4R3MN64_9FIRM|nr:methyl-accepting chemotaxis protein [Natranaerovirga pectinivora]TCT15474.1 methyl-accepting chemotaxis protein [Natranaerovirga pectinivora]